MQLSLLLARKRHGFWLITILKSKIHERDDDNHGEQMSEVHEENRKLNDEELVETQYLEAVHKLK
jgi:hypothetical protein